MAEDSTLLPNVDEPPGRATLYTAEKTVAIPGASGPGVSSAGGGSVTTTDIEFDYSPHLDRVVTALEQISISMALIAENTQDISSNLQDRIVPALETITAQQITIAAKQTAMETYQKKVKELAEGEGVHMVGPYEWLSMYAIYRLLVQENDSNWESIKAQMDALPKQKPTF